MTVRELPLSDLDKYRPYLSSGGPRIFHEPLQVITVLIFCHISWENRQKRDRHMAVNILRLQTSNN